MKKEIVYVLTAVAVAAGLYLILRSVGAKKKNDEESNTDQDPDDVSEEDPQPKPDPKPESKKKKDPFEGKPDIASSDQKFDEMETISEGSYGHTVAALQEDLNKNFDAKVKVDGKFGSETAKAVKEHYGFDRPFILADTFAAA